MGVVVNVSGATIEGIVPVGRSPKFALIENSLIVDITTADFDGDTLTTVSDSHITATPSVSDAGTLGLPTGAKPISMVNANGTIYVAESGRNVVGVLGASPQALTAEIPVGATSNAHPVNLTVLPNGKKVYSVNQAENTVTVISTADNSVLATVPVGTSPVWAVPSADSNFVFVVNQGSNNVSVVDATSDKLASFSCSAAPCVANPIPVGSGPNTAVFDAANQRVLITNPGSNSVTVIDANSSSPSFLLNPRTAAVGTNPTGVTALVDGTRFYVANTGSNSVSVVNSLSLLVSKTIQVGTSPVSIASDAESAQVFTANRDSFDVSVIKTSTDTELTDSAGNPHRLSAPQIDPTCDPTQKSCPKLNPIFVAVGPG
jgi:YVTN family beta-propeller protein